MAFFLDFVLFILLHHPPAAVCDVLLLTPCQQRCPPLCVFLMRSRGHPALFFSEEQAVTSDNSEAAGRTTATPEDETATGLFVGEVAQVRVWSSPCSEASLQRLVGRSGALEADATLVILWKADEGAGDTLRNSRPLQPPKPARGSKAIVGSGSGSGGTGAEGHADLEGEWAWVSCFDPDDYESAAASDQGSAAAGSTAVAGAGFAGAIGTPSSSSSAAQRSGRQGEEGFGGLAEGAETDLARSLGWRSVSTAGDEEEEVEEVEEGGGASASVQEKRGRSSGGCVNTSSRSSSSACAEAGANATAAGASAALAASAAIERAGSGGVRRLPPMDALLALLGKLFQQCSVYLAPCDGDPLVESTQPPRGVRVEARVQLQLVRREERALRAIVQPEVWVCR